MKHLLRLKEFVLKYSKKGLTPDEIALGIALGNFIGFIPIFGTHTVIALGLAHTFRLSPFFVVLGTQISNPLSFPIQLFLSAEIGSLVLNGKLLDIKFSGDLSYLSHYIGPILTGSLILGIAASIISYILIKTIFLLRKTKE
ncbi:MAG: DUF2062 domain-containing protein [Nitrospirota bacterium]